MREPVADSDSNRDNDSNAESYSNSKPNSSIYSYVEDTLHSGASPVGYEPFCCR
jgi:hypothetical protein